MSDDPWQPDDWFDEAPYGIRCATCGEDLDDEDLDDSGGFHWDIWGAAHCTECWSHGAAS